MQLGAKIQQRPYREWWDLMEQTERTHDDPSFVHPVADTDVLAGNGTIGLEIFDELPSVKSIFVPFGGGGLSVGIAAALHHFNADAAIYPCETEAGTPVTAAFRAGKPVRVDFNPHTFITGMGSSQVLRAMWPLIRSQLERPQCCTLADVARAIKRLLLDHHVVAEGAGAAAVAAALARPASSDPSVCIVSGGHLDPRHLIAALEDRVPEY